VGARVAGLAAVVPLLLAASLATAENAAPQRPPRKPEKKPVPSYSDDDLARYREQREREEKSAAEPEAPPAEPASAASPVSPAPIATSVVLKDLNGTLPSGAREQAEAAARRFVTVFEVPLDAPLVIPLRYFPAREAFRDHLARSGKGADDSLLGYYSLRRDEIVVGDSRDYPSVLLHEMCHFILHRVFDEVPSWLDEGLAEYFESSSAAPHGLVVMDNPAHRRRLGRWLAGDRRPDLRELMGTNASTWGDHDTAHAGLVRALAWSVVDFLRSSPQGRQVLRAFIARLKDHRGLGSFEAIAATFPGGAEAFERQWLEHVEARATPD
jgi:hypothetical protein